MRDTIRAVRIKNHLIDPTRAELWVTIVPNCLKQATEVRGRFLGPRCPYATTVEVAYPLQSFPHKPEDVPDLTFRVVIPEPSLWDPISPFLYEGYIGLWQNNLRVPGPAKSTMAYDCSTSGPPACVSMAKRSSSTEWRDPTPWTSRPSSPIMRMRNRKPGVTTTPGTT